MQISPGLGVAIMMNNYFHDMATGLLVGSGFALHAIIRIQATMSTPEATLFFLKTNAKMRKLFKFALWWVVLGGVPRTIFYTSFEWANAADKLQIPALAVKHVMMFAAVVGGGSPGAACRRRWTSSRSRCRRRTVRSLKTAQKVKKGAKLFSPQKGAKDTKIKHKTLLG